VNPLLFQQAATPTPHDAGGGIQVNFPTVDWTQLVPQLVGLFFDGIGKWLQDALHHTFDGLWGSGANVVGHTDLGMTFGFGPVVIVRQPIAKRLLS
jgi:hypothetical protein